MQPWFPLFSRSAPSPGRVSQFWPHCCPLGLSVGPGSPTQASELLVSLLCLTPLPVSTLSFSLTSSTRLCPSVWSSCRLSPPLTLVECELVSFTGETRPCVWKHQPQSVLGTQRMPNELLASCSVFLLLRPSGSGHLRETQPNAVPFAVLDLVLN